jgi:LuxR family transcriptional regulator, maltose regulon positive regulatory protein
MASVVAAQRNTIRRPRLTSMLDESSARIRLLVAPAGYGKTTLAREWLGERKRRAVWYCGGPASADVAALAAGVSEAAEAIIPNAGRRMRERLRAAGTPEKDVDILAEIFAEDVQSWPADAWLAIDDYQFAMESVASERFINLITETTPIQMLIACRVRPNWVTPRRILYGEIQEVGRLALAMRKEEVRELVGRNEHTLARFLERACGWPAVIGLVALSSSNPELTEAVPERLYDYFAAELYETLSETQRRGLARLSFSLRFDLDFAEQVLGAELDDAIDAGLRSGALNQFDRRSFDFHPLLAEFFQERAFRTFFEKQRAAAAVGQVLLTARRWDESVELARHFALVDLLIATIGDSLYSLLDSGRVATLTKWLTTGGVQRAHSAILDLAEGELAFRLGDYRLAEAMASQAARRLGSAHHLASRAYFRAGHSALLRSKEQLSISYFQKARDTARDVPDLREALFGLYSAMSELDLPEAVTVLAELDTLALESADDQVRAESAKLTNALRAGDLENAVEAGSLILTSFDQAVNPLITTSFLHVLSNASSAAGRYEQGLALAAQLLKVGSEHRLEFVRPFGIIDRAIGNLGIRAFADANHDIALTTTLVPDDIHIQGNLAALRCRLLLATGRASLAAEAAGRGFLTELPPLPLRSELLAFRALALACLGELGQSQSLLRKAEEVSRNTLVVQVLGPAVRALSSRDRHERKKHAHAVWIAASKTGHLDTLVCAYRAHPDLLREIMTVADRDHLAAILVRAHDFDLAHRYGLMVDREPAPQTTRLTPREIEVMDLVAAGLLNHEIAQTLFITESTVKAHVRHVYEKLGVRVRSEAVANWLTRPSAH